MLGPFASLRLRRGLLALLPGAWLLASCGGGHPLSLAPLRGGQIGGEAIRIEGEGFLGHGPLSVYFGVYAAKAVVIESEWLVTVLTPQSEEPGTVDVTMRFGDGTELVLPQAYSFEEQPGVVLRPTIGGG